MCLRHFQAILLSFWITQNKVIHHYYNYYRSEYVFCDIKSNIIYLTIIWRQFKYTRKSWASCYCISVLVNNFITFVSTTKHQKAWLSLKPQKLLLCLNEDCLIRCLDDEKTMSPIKPAAKLSVFKVETSPDGAGCIKKILFSNRPDRRCQRERGGATLWLLTDWIRRVINDFTRDNVKPHQWCN